MSRDSIEQMLDDETQVEKSLLDMQRPSAREAIEKAQPGLRQRIEGLERRLGVEHLQKQESMYADRQAVAHHENIRKAEGAAYRG